MPTLYPKEIETHSYDEILGNTLATELLKQVHMQIKESNLTKNELKLQWNELKLQRNETNKLKL